MNMVYGSVAGGGQASLPEPDVIDIQPEPTPEPEPKKKATQTRTTTLEAFQKSPISEQEATCKDYVAEIGTYTWEEMTGDLKGEFADSGQKWRNGLFNHLLRNAAKEPEQAPEFSEPLPQARDDDIPY